MIIPKRLRAWIKRFPRIRKLLLPIYSGLLDIVWAARKHLVRKPMLFELGRQSFQLNLAGSIPEVIFKGDFEPMERDFVSSYLKPGMVVVDAGANVGLYSLISSVLVGEMGRVYSFEPSRLSFQRFIANLSLNRCRNVFPYNMALSDINGTLILGADPLHPDLDSHRFIRTGEIEHAPQVGDETVEAQTLDACFKDSGLDSKVDFLKIDVEGAEFQMLRGAEGVLQSSPNITILLECTQNREEVYRYLTGLGFSCFSWDSANKVLKPAVYADIVPISNVIFRRA